MHYDHNKLKLTCKKYLRNGGGFSQDARSEFVASTSTKWITSPMKDFMKCHVQWLSYPLTQAYLQEIFVEREWVSRCKERVRSCLVHKGLHLPWTMEDFYETSCLVVAPNLSLLVRHQNGHSLTAHQIFTFILFRFNPVSSYQHILMPLQDFHINIWDSIHTCRPSSNHECHVVDLLLSIHPLE